MYDNTTKLIENSYIILPVNENNDKNIDRINETISLLETAGATNLGYSICKLKEIKPSTYIGSGKLEEIKCIIDEKNINLVVFDGELSPSQTINISEILGVDVIDRTTLILDIFAKNAKTNEGKIQVELAQLNYLYPRLKGKGISLSRLGGGIGTRGPGETKLETDRRHIRRRIDFLKEQINEINSKNQLQTYRRNKNNEFVISLIGYTNAGKSTLLNLLTSSNVLTENKLFATLDTTVRETKINNIKILFTDTVGFITDIPTHLIDAFNTTLKTALNSNLNIILLDSTQDTEKQLQVTHDTLNKLNCKTDELIVYNKCDAIDNSSCFNGICISAKTGFGIDKLKQAIFDYIKKEYSFLKLKIEYSKLNEFLKLQKYIENYTQTYNNEYVEFDIIIKNKNIEKLANFIKKS